MQEQAKFWYVPTLDRLELLQATCFTRELPRHTHETYAIGIIEQGIAKFDHQGIGWTASSGDVVVINPDEVHTCAAANEKGHTHRMLYPSIAIVQSMMSSIGERETIPWFKAPIVSDRRLAKTIHQLHITLATSTCELERETQLLQALTQLIRGYSDRPIHAHPFGQELQAVKQIKQYLEAYYAENVSLEQLSQLTNLSSFYLTRVFCRSTGLPPHAYLTQVRVLRAKQLLAAGNAIAQVALETGFTHQSHLNRHFKRLTRVTPKQYQQMSKNVQD
jgi:AraC-like DNA-binding protein